MTPCIPNPKSLALLALALPLAAQTPHKPSPQQTVTVVVLDAHAQPAQRISGALVSLSYINGVTHVSEDSKPTSSNGEAYLIVSSDAAQRGDLRVEISGVKDLVIYEPADGQLTCPADQKDPSKCPFVQMTALPSRITISLVPRGSPLLLGGAHMEAMLHRALLQLNSQQKQIQALKNQKPDLSAALAEVAQAYGFPTADFDKQVQQWAQQVQSDPAADARRKGLAETALKHYAEADKYFAKVDDEDDAALHAEEQKALKAPDSLLTALRQLTADRSQRAHELQLNFQYHEATGRLESAAHLAAEDQKRYPDDKSLRAIWLQAASAAAHALWLEGGYAPAAQSIPLLAQAAGELSGLADSYEQAGDQINWANTQRDLGNALSDEGERAASDQAAQLLERAVQAYQRALTVYTRSNTPLDWAWTQFLLSSSFVDQADRSTGDKAVRLLAQAVQADRAALEIFTRTAYPNHWAYAQAALATALSGEGRRAGGPQSATLLEESINAYRKALEVYTKAHTPIDWAGTQSNLGAVLTELATRSSGEKAVNYLDMAIEADEKSLEVFTREQMPQNWARTQHNIANALWDKANRTSGEAASALLEQAVERYRQALEVYTPADLPQDWASTESDLGNALSDEGYATRGPKAVAFFDQAVQAFQSALKVRTRTSLPQDWAQTQMNLGTTLTYEGEQLSGEPAAVLFDQAVAAYRNALEVFTKADLPQSWAEVQYDLGSTLEDESERRPAQAKSLLQQSEEAHLHALEVYTREAFPRDWSHARTNLGETYMHEGKYVEAAENYELLLTMFPTWKPFLAHLSHLYHDELFRFDRALAIDEQLLELDPTPGRYLDLLEASLTARHFDSCADRAARGADVKLSSAQTPVYHTIQLACEWAAGDKAKALAELRALAAAPSQPQPGAWDFAGTLHFLNNDSAFENGRSSWIALFTAVQNGDAPGVAAALHQLELLLQP